MTARLLWALALAFSVLGPARPAAAQDMPDPSLMHGRPLPAGELPAGTVTVRVVREALGNNIAGQEVRLTVGSATQTAKTDELGRAEFRNLPRGELARAEATVDGEALVSEPFAVPSSGGVRVALVAGLERAAARRKLEEAKELAAPATKGAVVLGPDSRIIMEFHDDALFAFYVLEILNNARARVDVGGPIVIELPPDAVTASLREGSTPAATVTGTRLSIAGPFPPGVTSLQVQFRVRYTSATHTLSQTFPIPLQRLTFGVQKRGDLAISSPQFTTVNDVPTEDGNVYAVGQGDAIPAGTPLTVTLSNLPIHSPLPKYIALGLVASVVGFGIWLAATAKTGSADERQALTRRRDALLDDLVRLEAQKRAGTVAPDKYDSRKKRIVGDLEKIYAQLEEESAA